MIACLCIVVITFLYTATRPSLRDLMRELRDVEADWRPIGLELGVPKPQLQSIHSTHAHQGQTQCMMEMLSFWLNYKPAASWNHVVAALRELQKESLVSSLATRYPVRMQKVPLSAASSAAGM